MVTYKVLLDQRRIKADETYPIIIRVTCDRKSTTIHSGVNVQSEFWDDAKSNVKPSHPNSLLINQKVTEFYLKIQKIVLWLEVENNFSLDNLRERLNADYKPAKVATATLFKDYSDTLINTLLSINKTGNAIIYKTAANKLMVFTNNPKLKFIDINFNLLDSFKNDLIKQGLKANTISNYFRTLRAIFNKAIKAKIIDRSHYPFLDITVKTEKTKKRAISLSDLQKLHNQSFKEKSAKWHAHNFFFISLSLIGISFTDLAYLKPGNIKKGRLVYKRRKTGKELNIKLLPFTVDLLNLYADSNSKYLLPILPSNTQEGGLEAKKVILQWIKTTNKWLNRIAQDIEIEDEITTYVSRHTWATTAKRLGYSNELIAESMGHEFGNKITNIYLDNFEQSVIDEVNERVISLLK